MTRLTRFRLCALRTRFFAIVMPSRGWLISLCLARSVKADEPVGIASLKTNVKWEGVNRRNSRVNLHSPTLCKIELMLKDERDLLHGGLQALYDHFLSPCERGNRVNAYASDCSVEKFFSSPESHHLKVNHNRFE